MKVGADGALQEWADDYGQGEEAHRHISHLYGLYPGGMLSKEVKSVELTSGIKKTLELRGDGGKVITPPSRVYCAGDPSISCLLCWRPNIKLFASGIFPCLENGTV